MKSFWKTILDGLTYKDLAGKRQPRIYTVVTGLILLLLLAAGGMAGLNRYLLMRNVQDAPITVSISTQVPETKEANTLTPAQHQDWTVTGCPIDPADWSFAPTHTSRTYAIIQPGCVYQGLEKTIAWALAIRQGYSRKQATEELGFMEMPMRQLHTVIIPATRNGLSEIPVSFIPPNPALTEWRVHESGKAAITYALRGCFRTSTITGNQVETWGGDYPVICMVVEDAENTHVVYSLDGHTYTSTATAMRSFLLFGYVADGLWVWLGTQDDPKFEITDPETFTSERIAIAAMYDSRPWDEKWLRDTYHLYMQPLPDGWLKMTDENEKQYILNGLSTGSVPQ